MTERTLESVKEQIWEGTPPGIAELIYRQLQRADEAHERIQREGSVVRDLKGNVIAHPAIAIEKEATKLAADLLQKHKKY